MRSSVSCSESAACRAVKSGAPFNDLAVDNRIGQRFGLSCDRTELPRPIEPRTRLQGHLLILHAQLNTIAIELDLVSPAAAGRWPLDRFAELGRYEVRKRSI